MEKMAILTALLTVLLTAGTALAGLDPHLEGFETYVGKTFTGTFVDQATGAEGVDVQRWEATLGGKAIRVVHSLNQGEYGGETIIFWNAAKDAVTFYYFTTAGFLTQGTVTIGEGVFTAHEIVEGEAGGITEVRSTSRALEDGRIKAVSEFLKDGQWVPGHEIIYAEDPDAEVVFK
jgi:hypothetical protein